METLAEELHAQMRGVDSARRVVVILIQTIRGVGSPGGRKNLLCTDWTSA